eukprot:TRINITY_DN2199_c0_g1_i1.p1 TRINITY_DN2199_c0_g1~~TRINITY_DN2199_c0_g1_i1.p1  ORF type:complete len:178 (+),score=61.86 TRINITY_DN2199_c0_g1_i1:68-601(+)
MEVRMKLVEVEFTEFTPDELKAFRESFNKYDLDHNGQLELFELHQMYEKMGEPKTNAELTQLIKEADQTKKGGIDYKDFLTILLKDKKGLLKGWGSITKIAKHHDESKETGKKANIFEQKAAQQAAEKEAEEKVRREYALKKQIQQEEREKAQKEKERKEKVAAGLAKLKAGINQGN